MPISDLHRTWLRDICNQWFDDGHGKALLRLTSHSEEGGGAPRWLLFCDYLAKVMVNRHAEPVTDDLEQQLHEWAMQLWGPERLDWESLAQAWFGVRHPTEIIERAFAVASLVGQHHDKSLPPLFPDQLTDQLLSVQEQAALVDYLVERHGSQDRVRVPVLLVNNSAAPGEQGRRAQLRLTPVRVPSDQHGQLFRAPAALLLSLRTAEDSSFEDGLRKVERLFGACLKPAGEEGGWGLLWSLHPEPMVLDRRDPQKPYDWFMQSITGPSATGAFALAGLWVLREQLDESLDGMTLAIQQLRDIHPSQMAISAQLDGEAPPEPLQPLGWCWDRVGGLDEKLGSFVRDRQLMSDNESPVSLVLVSKNQGYKGTLIQPEPVKTIADVLDLAHREIGAPLPEAAERLRRFLLDQATPVEEAQPKTPLAPPELINPLRPEILRSEPRALDGPNHVTDVGKPNAIAWYLLRCYVRWAGGDHILWGEPARLAEDFFPICLETDAVDENSGNVGQNAETTRTKKRDARSLIQLLDAAFLSRQPPLWLLSAPPAAGKTTMMAEYQLHHAYKALHQYALSGYFGVVPLWIPARELDPGILNKGSLDQAIGAWLQDNWPALGSLRALLKSKHARIQVLLDGINELKCTSDHRSKILSDWLTAHFGLTHTHRPPLLTVRSLEVERLQGALVAQLQPWGMKQCYEYVEKRLEKHPGLLRIMKAALHADIVASGKDPEKMLYGSPGMLSLACTLMLQGLLPHDDEIRPMTRARLLSTLIWSRLEAEDENHNRTIPNRLLGREEKSRLKHLPESLRRGHWHPPELPGLLLSALAEQARQMQFESPTAEIELPEDEWWAGSTDVDTRDALTRAANHMGVVHSRRGSNKNGRACDWLGFRHQLLLEFFATYALTPDGPWPATVVPPKMKSVQDDYLIWFNRRKAWEQGRRAIKDVPRPRTVWDLPVEDRFDYVKYRLPKAEISPLEETFKLAAQLRGEMEDWVSRLIDVGNAPLAARLALENWAAFGEPLYPQDDSLGPWRPERKKGEKVGTSPVLNKLRKALFARMQDRETHLAYRVEAGELLGKIGGCPSLSICGEALILNDDYWIPVGEEGQFHGFEMGDLDGDSDEQTSEGSLYRVKFLPAFRMAGFLVTNVQFKCFILSGQYRDPAWWPGVAEEWMNSFAKMEDSWSLKEEAWKKELHSIDVLDSGLWDSAYDSYKRKHESLQSEIRHIRDAGLLSALEQAWRDPSGSDFPSLLPFAGSYWQAQAYSLWEQSQRLACASDELRWEVCLPTEAHWEYGARWAQLSQKNDAISKGAGECLRWKFAHVPGIKGRVDKVGTVRIIDYFEGMEGVRFVDVSPWDFNHGEILGSPSPVGVFVESNARNQEWPSHLAFRDLAGNVWEWCSSRFDTLGGKGKLDGQVELEAVGLELRAQRGGGFECTAAQCRLSSRVGDTSPIVFEASGLRMIMVRGLLPLMTLGNGSGGQSCLMPAADEQSEVSVR